MKTWDDVVSRAKAELDQWFFMQCKDTASYYWYYMPSSPEHNGGFLICKDKPANPDYLLVMPEPLGQGLTKTQNLNRFLKVAAHLPILEV